MGVGRQALALATTLAVAHEADSAGDPGRSRHPGCLLRQSCCLLGLRARWPLPLPRFCLWCLRVVWVMQREQQSLLGLRWGHLFQHLRLRGLRRFCI